MSFSGSFTTPTKKFKQTKRLACETWWNYSPVNTTEFGVENIVKFQIPTTDAIFDMSRAFISLDYMMPVQLVGFTQVNDLQSDFPSPEYLRTTFHSLSGSELETYEFADGDILLSQSTGYGTGLESSETASSGWVDSKFVQVADFGGFSNAATIFSLTEMYMDGNLLSHDDYCQTQARLWQENKSQSWLEGQKQTFFTPCSSYKSDLDCETYSTVFNNMILNKNNILPANINSKTGVGAKYYVKKQLKIPLVMLYPQFEVLNGWPSFLVKQILYLQLTVSDVTKYFCSFYSPELDTRDFNVLDISTRNNSCTANTYLDKMFPTISNGRNPQFLFNNTEIFTKKVTEIKDFIFEFDIDNLQLQNVTLYLPAHTPEFKERQEYQVLVNKGLTYGFKSFNILSNTFDLTVDNATGSNTQAQSYNSSVNNLEAINMLTMRDGTEVVYDKPSISALQCNLGNSWMQAASGTHVENLYSMDTDLYGDLLKGWGQLDKAYYNTISKAMEKSFKFNDGALYGIDCLRKESPLSRWGILTLPNNPTDSVNNTIDYFRPNYGSYTSYFDVSPGDEMGVSSGQYSKLINLRFNTTRPSIPSGIDLSNGADSRCNYPNAKIYMCQLTFSTLVITASSVFISNPFASEVDIRGIIQESQNLNMQANGYRNHGFTSTHGFIGNMLKNIGMQIAPSITKGFIQLDDRLKQKRLKKFQTKARQVLGPKGYSHYQSEIDHWGQYIKPISKRKLKTWAKEWKKTNQSGTTSGTIAPTPKREHGYSSKLIPGTYIKKFRVLSRPRIRAGWRGGINARPIRLQPFGRQATVPYLVGSMTNKHGLMPPYHGILNNLYHLIKPIVKPHIPEQVTNVLKPLKPYADPIINQLKPHLKPKIEQFDDKVTQHVDNIVKKPGGKGRGFFHWLGRVFGKKKNYGLGAKYMQKSMFNRFYKTPNPYKMAVYNRRRARRAGLIGKSSSTGLAKYFGGVTPPHMKKVSEFYREYYGNKHGKNVIRLQKALARGGAQRMYEGMY